MREIKPVTVEYARQFDAPHFEAHFLKVTQADFNYARAQLEPSLILAIEQAHDNIQKFHQQQMPDPMWFTRYTTWHYGG
jgi:histidinol dehydrogenase